jgi:hypothetical protein
MGGIVTAIQEFEAKKNRRAEWTIKLDVNLAFDK